MAPELDIESAAASREGSPRFRVALAVLVGVAALSAAALAWLEADSGRKEERAFVDASRTATEAFVKIAASQPKLHFELAALRESTLLSAQSTARPVSVGGGLVALQLALALSTADNDASRRLVEVTRALGRLPASAEGLDPPASDAIRLENQRQADEIYAAQESSLEAAEEHGTRQERAMFGLGLVAISASLLGVAGLTGESRAGRWMLATSALSILVALAAAVTAL
jgi:hypothetical protein